MNKCLMGSWRPLRIISRLGGRSTTVFTILFLFFLLQPLPLSFTNHNSANEKNTLGVEQFPPVVLAPPCFIACLGNRAVIDRLGFYKVREQGIARHSELELNRLGSVKFVI